MISTERTALVVDDEPQVRKLTCRALLACGFQCDQAADGHEAIRLAKEKAYDAVVTDLRMPNRHGHALCTDLMELDKPPQVLVLTALGDARLVRDLLSRGVHDVIQKPVQYDVLAMKVLSAVDGGGGGYGSTTPRPTPKKAKSATKINLLQRIETTLKEVSELYGERLSPLFEQIGELTDPPVAVRDFIRRSSDGEGVGSEVAGGDSYRMRDRVTCYTLATAVPVDRHWNRVDDPFKVAVRDLSESGIRLVNSRATSAQFLALSWKATQLPSTLIRIVVQVQRCNPCGRFYDIGGQFTMAD